MRRRSGGRAGGDAVLTGATLANANDLVIVAVR
jgi:hypothetical protein